MAGKKILVADDSLTIQKVIRLALSNEGYEIQAVSDGNDAVQQISLFRPDVVLIDVSLPGQSAFEVKASINEQGDLGDVQFILMSSAFEKVDEELAEKVRFHGRLTKPFDPAHLRQVLSDAFAHLAAKRTEPTSIISLPPDAPTEDTGEFDSSISLEPPQDDLTPPPIALPETGSSPPRAPQAKSPKFPPPLPSARYQPESDLAEEEELLAPIRPDDSGSITLDPPQAPPPVQNLWDREAEGSGIIDSPPPPPPANPFERHEPTGTDNEIKHLTESTIRMSGLDDFQWSVQETARKPSGPSVVGDRTLTSLQVREPAIKPGPNFADLSGTTFRLEPETSIEPPFHPEQAEPVQSVQFNEFGDPTFTEAPDFGTSSFPSLNTQFIEQDNASDHEPARAPQALKSAASSDEVMSLTQSQLEDLIHRQVQDTLEKLAQRILPEVAERVIKQEINKLLNEQI